MREIRFEPTANELRAKAFTSIIALSCRSGGMADAGDSKSPARKGMSVRIRPPAPPRTPLTPTLARRERG